MLCSLPTDLQPHLCLYFTTTIMQQSSCIFGILRIHHIKIISAITSINVPSFSASDVTVFMSFLKTKNISICLMTPDVKEALYNHHFPGRPTTTVQSHKLLYIILFTHTSPTYKQTSFQNFLLTYGVPKYVQSCKHIAFLPHNSWIPNSYTLSIRRLTPCVQTISFTYHTSIRTTHLFLFSSQTV